MSWMVFVRLHDVIEVLRREPCLHDGREEL